MGFFRPRMGVLGLHIALVGAALTGPGAWMPAVEPSCGIGGAPANVQRIEIASGDRLTSVLGRAGARRREIAALRQSFGRRPNLNTLAIGDRIEVATTSGGHISWFRYRKSLVRAACARRDIRGAFIVTRASLPAETELARVEVTVERTLPDAMRAAGEGAELAAMTREIFAERVFSPEPGEVPPKVTLLVERRTIEGEILDYGRIFAAELTKEGVTERAFHYVADDGGKGYYTSAGDPRLGTRLRSPVPGAVVTSTFGPRYHPIKKRRRMHKGIDYGAARGTPVLAAADGVVTYRRWKRQLGRLVILRHSDGLTTRYAHLSDFALKVRKGTQVRQGQTIGYVGSTGLSSGAHLHFETLLGGRQVDPDDLMRTPAPSIGDAEREAFEAHVEELLLLLHPQDDAPTGA